jgi:hypothetical protein
LDVNEKQLLIYISYLLTILGITSFVQWSLLSNITAGIIMYRNYHVKIGDGVTILENNNNNNITGKLKILGHSLSL